MEVIKPEDFNADEFEQEEISSEDFNPDDFEEVPLPGAIESAMSGQPQMSDVELQESAQGLPESVEAAGAAFSEVVPGLRSTVAGGAAALGEGMGRERTDLDPSTLSMRYPQRPDQPEPIEDYEVIGPDGKPMSVKDAPSTFQEARMAQMKKDEELFMNNKTISILAAIAGPGVNLQKLAKKSPAIISKMAEKSPKLAKALEYVLPNGSKIEQAERLQDAFSRLEKYGKFKKLDKFKSAANKLKAAQAATDALKMGTFAGFAYSEDPLSTQAVKNAAMSGALGTVGSYGFVRGAQGLGWLFSESPGLRYVAKAFEYGKKGEKINKEMIDEDITKLGKDFIGRYNKVLNQAAESKNKILESMDQMQIKINNADDLAELKKSAFSKMSDSERKQAAPFFDFLDDYLEGGKEYQKMMKKIENKITKKIVESDSAEDVAKAKLEKMAVKDALKRGQPILEVEDAGPLSATEVGGRPEIEAMGKTVDYRTRKGLESKTYATDIPSYDPTKIEWSKENGKIIAKWQDKNTGKTFAEVADVDWDLDPSDMSFQDTNLMMKKLSNFYEQGKDEKWSPALRNMILKLRKGMEEKMNIAAKEQGFDIPKINKKLELLNNLKETSTGFGKINQPYQSSKLADEQTAMTELIKGKGDHKGKLSAEEYDKFFTFMQKADPELYNEYLPKIKKFREMWALAEPTEHILQAASLKSIIGPILGGAIKAGETGGRAYKWTGDNVGKLRTFLLAKKNPDHLGMVQQLDKARKADETTRQRIMWGLMSSPAFRKVLGMDTESQKKKDED